MRLNIKIWGDSLKEFWSYGDEGGLVTSKFSAPLVAKLQYHKLILSTKKEYYSSLVSSASDNPKRLWQTINKLLHRKSSSPLPTTSPGTSLADSFASFFHRQNIQTPSFSHQQPDTSSPHSPSPPATPLISRFSFLPQSPKSTRSWPTAEQAIWFTSHPNLASQRMFIRTCFYNHQYCQPLSHFWPVSSPSRNLSSLHCLRNPFWINRNSPNYRPISNLSIISKIIECRQIPSHGSPHFQQSIQFSSLNWNSSFVHPQSPCQCNRITESVVFGNYAAVAANMPNREFRAPNVVSEMPKLWF